MARTKQAKACDFCYRRKIKCDAKKPQCSSCVLHHSPCTFQATSRKATKRRARSDKKDASPLSHPEATEKIHQLERLPEQKTPSNPALPTEFLKGIQNIQPQDNHQAQDLPVETLDLPPLQDVLPAVEAYLTTLNSRLPLFRPDHLIQTVKDWYVHPSRRRTTTWAAINVVLALSYQQCSPATSHAKASHHLNAAQSVLSGIIMGKAELANVQVLLGMVMLFVGTEDLKPAAMLIAIALRLAHQLGLHVRQQNAVLDQEHTPERDRVFWVAYCLDRDICLRTRQPPVQHDDNVYIDWPDEMPPDGAGLVATADGSACFNFFRACVLLAHIHGHVYNFMAARYAGVERPGATVDLNGMLDSWVDSVPTPFQPGHVARTTEPHVCRGIAILHLTYLSCRTMACRAHAMDHAWMQNLRSFGTTTTAGLGLVLPAPLPTASETDWERLIGDTRMCMRLFWAISPKDSAFLWMSFCGYISGSICLTAYTMFHPGHANVQGDQKLLSTAMDFLEDLATDTGGLEPVIKMRNVLRELLDYAQAVTGPT